jgi:hypothetical protein
MMENEKKESIIEGDKDNTKKSEEEAERGWENEQKERKSRTEMEVEEDKEIAFLINFTVCYDTCSQWVFCWVRAEVISVDRLS